MPLKHQYLTTRTIKAEAKLNPSLMPAAGGTTGRLAVIENNPLVFHRRKHRGDEKAHLAVDSDHHRFNGTSTIRSDFVAKPIPKRVPRINFNATIQPEKMSGLGHSVEGLDETKEWMSTKRATLDHGRDADCRHLGERNRTEVYQRLHIPPWEATTKSSFSDAECRALCREVVTHRQQFLLQRTQSPPKMHLA